MASQTDPDAAALTSPTAASKAEILVLAFGV